VRSRVLICAAVLALSGCETTQVAPAVSADSSLEVDEARLWQRAQEEKRVLDESGFVLPAPAATAYLDDLLARLQSQPLARGATLHARIVVDPTLNAFALPDGSIYIHSGLLARLGNEAQLATVLAHELTHATHRHALRGHRQLKNQTSFMVSFTVGTGGLGGLLGLLGAASAVSGYSQELETEADELGFAQVRRLGYDPRESVEVFRVLLAESERSKIKVPYFFASHPRLTERIANFERLVAALPPAERTGRTGADEYSRTMVPIFVANANAATQAGDYDAALASAQRALTLEPELAPALLAEAETYRRRAQGNDHDLALQRYQRLTERPECPPTAHRGAGLLLFKRGDRTAAAQAFRRYLAAAPQAPDRGHIENQLRQCESSSTP
jgi:predicted Zn-dependent protease